MLGSWLFVPFLLDMETSSINFSLQQLFHTEGMSWCLPSVYFLLGTSISSNYPQTFSWRTELLFVALLSFMSFLRPKSPECFGWCVISVNQSQGILFVCFTHLISDMFSMESLPIQDICSTVISFSASYLLQVAAPFCRVPLSRPLFESEWNFTQYFGTVTPNDHHYFKF